jgi:DNA-binding response OmpR family regulator
LPESIHDPAGRGHLRLLVAEDDRALGVFLTRGLEAEGHQVIVAADGMAAVELFQQEAPDLIVLDLNLPRRDGMEVLRFLRSVGSESPVLVLTARTELEVRVQCLDLGADDCMVKPFALTELRARCRALLRRRRDTNFLLRHGDLEVNRVERSVSREGQMIVLTNKEFALLEHLLLHRGRVVSRTTLLEKVWNMHAATSTNVVDVYVNYLRRKLSDSGTDTRIQTVRGEGYAIGFSS